MPLDDAVGTAFIAGQVRKWAARLLDVDPAALRDQVAASRDHILRATS